MYVRMCISIYIYTNIHTYIYIYTYAQLCVHLHVHISIGVFASQFANTAVGFFLCVLAKSGIIWITSIPPGLDAPI